MGITIGSDPIFHEKGSLAAPDESGDKIIATREWVTENAPSSPGGPSYLVYAPILTQTSTDAPLVIGSVNTMGFTTWQRTGTGSYRAASTTPYDANKTWLSGLARSGGNPSVIPLYNFSAISGYISIAYDGNNGVMNVYIDVLDASFQSAELGSLVDIFSFPELRKYE